MQILSGIPEIIVAIFNRDNFIFEIYPKYGNPIVLFVNFSEIFAALELN